MDGAYALYSTRKVDTRDFAATIETFQKGTKWRPALLAMRQTLTKEIGGKISRFEDRFSTRRGTRNETFDDMELFFDKKTETLLYIINSPLEALSGPGLMEARRRMENSLEAISESRPDGVLIGAVGPNAGALDEIAEDFRSDFESALRSSIDGRRARHIQFDWVPLPGKPKRRALAHLREADEEPEVRFSAPSHIDDATLQKVAILTDPAVRIIIREIAESGFARRSDLLGRRGKKQEEFDTAVGKLKSQGLIESEYLLQCRKTSAQLVRVKDREQLSKDAVSGFSCASCNRSFAEELTSEGYLMSSTGKELTKGSHWMTILVTKYLLDLGVTMESIMWNVEESGEEVDLIIEHADRVWIFELKDREFGAGDAYPFNYRKVRYKAEEAVVVTTEKVAPDAHRVFSDLSRKRNVHIIEGLENLPRVLGKSFQEAGLDAVRNALSIPSAVCGFDLVNWHQSRPKSL